MKTIPTAGFALAMMLGTAFAQSGNPEFTKEVDSYGGPDRYKAGLNHGPLAAGDPSKEGVPASGRRVPELYDWSPSKLAELMFGPSGIDWSTYPGSMQVSTPRAAARQHPRTVWESNKILHVIYDPGGKAKLYDPMYADMAHQGYSVHINGACGSACDNALLHFDKQHLCISAEAVMAFHAIHRDEDQPAGQDGPIDSNASYAFIGRFPAGWLQDAVRDIVLADINGTRPGGDFIPAKQFIDHGYQQCPARDWQKPL